MDTFWTPELRRDRFYGPGQADVNRRASNSEALKTKGPSERAFQGAVVDLCRLRGYLTYHTHDSRRSDPGFPDLVIVGHGQVLYRELKRAGGRVSPIQRVWIEWLERNGADVAVWTPKDWPLIERTL